MVQVGLSQRMAACDGLLRSQQPLAQERSRAATCVAASR